MLVPFTILHIFVLIIKFLKERVFNLCSCVLRKYLKNICYINGWIEGSWFKKRFSPKTSRFLFSSISNTFSFPQSPSSVKLLEVRCCRKDWWIQVCGFAGWKMVFPSDCILVFYIAFCFFLDGCGVSHLSCHYHSQKKVKNVDWPNCTKQVVYQRWMQEKFWRLSQ